jgi:hypothetical protein
MLSNAPVSETRNKPYKDQIERVSKVGFDEELPTMNEYLLLIVTTQKASQKAICLYGQDPLLTYGRSSTLLDAKRSLVIGGSAAGRVGVDDDPFGPRCNGAGGCRKF